MEFLRNRDLLAGTYAKNALRGGKDRSKRCRNREKGWICEAVQKTKRIGLFYK